MAVSTPNLDSMLSRQSEIQTRLAALVTLIASAQAQFEAWSNLARERHRLWDNTASIRKSLKAERWAIYQAALAKKKYYEGIRDSYYTEQTNLKNELAQIKEALINYRDAVNTSLAMGGTDAGSAAVAEQMAQSIADESTRASEEFNLKMETLKEDAEAAKKRRNIFLWLGVGLGASLIGFIIYKATQKNKPAKSKNGK